MHVRGDACTAEVRNARQRRRMHVRSEDSSAVPRFAQSRRLIRDGEQGLCERVCLSSGAVSGV